MRTWFYWGTLAFLWALIILHSRMCWYERQFMREVKALREKAEAQVAENAMILAENRKWREAQHKQWQRILADPFNPESYDTEKDPVH